MEAQRLAGSAPQRRHCLLEAGRTRRRAGRFSALPGGKAGIQEASRALAAIALERGRNDEALDLHIKLIESGERSPEFLYNAALLRQKSGQHEQAAQLYREALTGSPEFAEALLNLGIALEALGQPDEARTNWQKALTLKPDLAKGYFSDSK